MEFLLADRLDRQFHLAVEPGEAIRGVLARNHVPFDAVVLRRNGAVVDDWNERFDPAHDYRIDMVRAYHLPDLLALGSLWEHGETPTSDVDGPGEPFYTKRHFAHADDGDYNSTLLTFSREDYVDWVEQMFVDGTVSQHLIRDGDDVLLAVSGGKDSLALGYFLSRTQHRLPRHNLSAVHVTTFSKPAETCFAQEMAAMFDHPLTLVGDDEVARAYQLEVTPREALAALRDRVDPSHQIAAVHSMMRSSIERVARRTGVRKIAFGLMREDILTSIVKSMFVGFPFGGSYRKQQHDLEMVYPLWPVGKKELTLYLEALYPTSNTQGSPVTFERGSLARDAHYLIADSLESIVPSASFQLFAGHERMVQAYVKLPTFALCDRCEMSFQTGAGAAPTGTTRCQLCSTLVRIGVARA